MTPVTFNGCFGWLHQDGAGHGHEIAVLIYPSLNHDALNAYHANRLLADQFAAAGYPAMRFDYPNSGDSADIQGYGPHADINLWDIWRDAVDVAADTLRRQTGALRVILCGFRIGATLAALAAATRRDVAGLILLSPVIKGQSYLRQLSIEAQLHDSSLPPLTEGLRFQEICFNPATVRAIAAVDLRDIAPPSGAKIAIFAPSRGRLIEECRLAWERSGAEIFSAGFEGFEPMLTMNVEDHKAHPHVAPALAWLRGAIPSGRRGQMPPVTKPTAILNLPRITETPLRFGAGCRLFGMLCQPEQAGATDIVLIVNAGRDPRHGPGRFHVELARKLAEESVASLRLDFAGLGDSIGPPGEEDLLSSLLDTDRTADISAAIDALARLGFRNFAAYGLCAGAYHAMRAAISDPRLSRLLLVNMPLLDWRPGEGIDFIRHKNMPLRYFLGEFAKLRSWPIARHKILKSGSVLRGQLLRLASTFANAKWSPARWSRRFGGAGLTEGQKNIALLLRRNVKTLFLFGENDLGLDAVTRELDPLRTAHTFAETITIQVLANFDHLVSHEPTRRAAAQNLRAFLRRTATKPPPCAMKETALATAPAGSD